jgi:hypothetical protein
VLPAERLHELIEGRRDPDLPRSWRDDSARSEGARSIREAGHPAARIIGYAEAASPSIRVAE